jgi:hypothetical protein
MHVKTKSAIMLNEFAPAKAVRIGDRFDCISHSRRIHGSTNEVDQQPRRDDRIRNVCCKKSLFGLKLALMRPRPGLVLLTNRNLTTIPLSLRLPRTRQRALFWILLFCFCSMSRRVSSSLYAPAKTEIKESCLILPKFDSFTRQTNDYCDVHQQRTSSYQPEVRTMRDPLEGVEPATLHILVGLIAVAHVLAIVVWLCLVATGRAGSKTAWETPPEPRPVSRRATPVAAAGSSARSARASVASTSSAAPIAADALRRRRGGPQNVEGVKLSK